MISTISLSIISLLLVTYIICIKTCDGAVNKEISLNSLNPYAVTHWKVEPKEVNCEELVDLNGSLKIVNQDDAGTSKVFPIYSEVLKKCDRLTEQNSKL